MSFHQYGKTVKFPRDERANVDIHVRRVRLNADAPEAEQREYVEIREYLKGAEIYGHGIVLPVNQIRDLNVALARIAPETDSVE